MAPTPKSLTLDLLATQRDGSMPVRALVEAGALFGLAENSIRVALARMQAVGLVQRDARGRYRRGPASEAVQARVASWRRLHEDLAAWDGAWIAVHCTRRSGRAARRRSARALRLLGFRELEPGLDIRPDNLAGGVGAMRRQLVALGLEAGALVAGLRDLDTVSDRRARQLWNTRELSDAYAESRRRLAQSVAGLPMLSNEAAMVETFLLGGSVLRQLVLDPLLPEAIVPTAPRQALLEDMRAYDRLGRSSWAAFLARLDVPHVTNPVDLRVADAAGLGLSLPALTSTETGT
ncbi:MAG: PaaX family transcriptional regulator [Myxococcota bacterium]